MNKSIRWLVLTVILLSLLLSACGASEATVDETKPVTLEPISGTDLNRITLTEKAAERLGLETAPVHVNSAKQMVIPYAALLYDASGGTWVYTTVAPLVYVRQAIVVDSINGNEAVLSEGLENDAVVVTLGATELYGSEAEFEEE
jgi:uncharacterized protein YcfL